MTDANAGSPAPLEGEDPAPGDTPAPSRGYPDEPVHERDGDGAPDDERWYADGEGSEAMAAAARTSPIRGFFGQWWRAWLTIDPRTLGIFRLTFGAICIADVIRRLPHIALMYTDAGVLPRKLRPHYGIVDQPFSLLNGFGTESEVTAFFLFTLAVAVLFTLGWRTRVMQVLLLIGLLSIHNANLLVENAGCQVMNVMLIWTVFLPLGMRFSLDAWRRSIRHKERTPAELNAPGFAARWRTQAARPVTSLAVFAIYINVSFIYLLNAIHKSGGTWKKDGTSVYYLLQLDTFNTDLAAAIRDGFPLWLSQALSWGTLVIEGAAIVFIMTPLLTDWGRRMAIFSLYGLHAGILLTCNVGVLTHVMFATLLLLLSARDLDFFGRVLRRFSAGPFIAFYDSDCGVCHLTARIHRRLDAFGRVIWAGHDWTGPEPEGLAALRPDTVVVWDSATGAIHTRQAGMSRLIDALPGGFLVGWVFRLPLIGQLTGVAYDLFAYRRTRVSVALGLAACGISHGGGAAAMANGGGALPGGPTGVHRRLARSVSVFLATAAIATLLVSGVTDGLDHNPKAKPLKFDQPREFDVVRLYTRARQSWNMFSPNVPRTEGRIVIDAITADGRRIDPMTGQPPDYGPNRRGGGVDYSQLWRKYNERIHRSQFRGQLAGLREFLINWHRFHGLPKEDKLVSFVVSWVSDRSRPPEERTMAPKVAEPQVLLRWDPHGDHPAAAAPWGVPVR